MGAAGRPGGKKTVWRTVFTICPFGRKEGTMDQKAREQAVAHSHRLMQAPSCSQEARQAAQAWLDALDTPAQAEQTRKYLQELEEDVMGLDDLIAFVQSPAGEKFFGAQKAAEMAAHSLQRKAAGEKYCDCPACSAAAAILDLKEGLLAQA